MGHWKPTNCRNLDHNFECRVRPYQKWNPLRWIGMYRPCIYLQRAGLKCELEKPPVRSTPPEGTGAGTPRRPVIEFAMSFPKAVPVRVRDDVHGAP